MRTANCSVPFRKRGDEFKQWHPIIITLSAQSRREAGEGEEASSRHNYLNFIQGTRHRQPRILKGDGSPLSFLPVTPAVLLLMTDPQPFPPSPGVLWKRWSLRASI